MFKSNQVIAAGAWGLENGHRLMLALTGGRFPKNLAGMKTLELHTIGRKSGISRGTLLTAPIVDTQKIVVVASKGGHQEDPQWYKNLAANPEVTVTIDNKTHKMLARTAEGAERATLWKEITSNFKQYAGYQKNTDREIPVVICEYKK